LIRARNRNAFNANGFKYLCLACKWSGLFALAICIVIVAVIRLMQSWRTQFADGYARDWYRPGLARFQILSFRGVLRAAPGAGPSGDLRSASWIVVRMRSARRREASLI
jgi:hypothetical protein